MKIPWGFILFFILTFVPLAIPSAEIPYTILVALIGMSFALAANSVMSEKRFGVLGHLRVTAQYGRITQGRRVALLQNALVMLCQVFAGWHYALVAWIIAAIMLDITLAAIETSIRATRIYFKLRSEGVALSEIESEIERRLK